MIGAHLQNIKKIQNFNPVECEEEETELPAVPFQRQNAMRKKKRCQQSDEDCAGMRSPNRDRFRRVGRQKSMESELSAQECDDGCYRRGSQNSATYEDDQCAQGDEAAEIACEVAAGE